MDRDSKRIHLKKIVQQKRAQMIQRMRWEKTISLKSILPDRLQRVNEHGQLVQPDELNAFLRLRNVFIFHQVCMTPKMRIHTDMR